MVPHCFNSCFADTIENGHLFIILAILHFPLGITCTCFLLGVITLVPIFISACKCPSLYGVLMAEILNFSQIY